MAYANDLRTPVSCITAEEKASVLDDVVEYFTETGELEKLFRRPLGNAAHDGDVDRMRKLLAYGASANTLCTGGDLIIHKLAARGNQPAVEALLRYGALVDERDGRGATPLQLAAVHNHAHQAAHGGSVGVIATLLRHGASVNSASANGCTALHNAASCDNVGAITLLVRDGRANINALDRHGRTPLHIAAQTGYPASVTTLCRLGADKSRRDWTGHTPFERVIASGNLGVVEVLLDAGVDADLRHGTQADGFSALDKAAGMGNLNLMRLLLRYRATVNIGDSTGRTALHKAAYSNQVGAIHLLVEAGAGLNARDSNGRTPLHRACGRAADGAVRALLGHGARVNALDNNGQSPLQRAARVSQQDSSAQVVGLLLWWDADETLLDNKGYTAAAAVCRNPARAASNPSVLGQLARAPANRAWRRRSLVVMCRARLIKEPRNLNLPEREVAPRPMKSARVEGGGDDDAAAVSVGGRGIPHPGAAEGASSVADEVVGKVVGMSEEGVFRNVMKFL